jgi:hypothetical protein
LTLGGTLAISAGGTGLAGTPTNGQLLIGNGSGYTLASLSAGTAISVTNATGSISIANTAPDQTVTLTDGTAISVTGTYPSFTVTNTAPDQTVTLTSGTNISVTGTYPSFSIANTSTADVVGPAGATSGAISLFDGSTGKLLKNSVITINGSGVISNVNTPNTGTDAANKQYVDDLASTGLHYHEAVVLSTSPGSSRTDTYNNGTAGVSATLTSVAAGTLVIDGTVATSTIRVLIQDCSNPIGNGVYVVTNPGSTVAQYVMTRSSDADTYIEQSTVGLDAGSYFFTTGGTNNKGAAWVNTNSGTISFGSTAITFSLFSNSQVYSAGNGLSLTATTFSLDTPVTVLNGGTGQSSAPTDGQLLIGNGSNYTLSTLTAGSGVTITNATGSITIAATGIGSSISVTTINATNVEATNIKAKDGTAAIIIADTTGAVTVSTPTVVSVNSSGDALRITQVGTGNALTVEDSANPDSTPVVIDNTGRLISGHTANISGYAIQVANSNPFDGVRWNASSTGPTNRLAKSRSATPGSYSIVSNGDSVGTLAFAGDDGVAFINAATIATAVDGAPSVNSMPGRLVLSTTASGSSTPTERMRIDSSGNVGIGKTPTTKLDVSGTITTTNIIVTGEYSGTISGGTY